MNIIYSVNAPESLGFFGGTLVASVILAIIAFFVFTAMIRWKIFVKAGEKGWKSLIPFYGDYIEYRIVWDTKWFWVEFIAGMVMFACLMIPVIGLTILVAILIFQAVIQVVFAMQEAHAFGKDDGFAIGLMTFGFVFQILLAFDDNAKYVGPQPSPSFFERFTKKAEVQAGTNFEPYTGEPLNKKD